MTVILSYTGLIHVSQEGHVVYVVLGNTTSLLHTVTCGAPRALFLLQPFSALTCFPSVMSLAGMAYFFHCYADDTQLPLKVTPSSLSSSVSQLDVCLEEVKARMTENCSKTKAIQFGSLTSSTPTPTPSLTNLEVKFENHTTNISTCMLQAPGFVWMICSDRLD